MKTDLLTVAKDRSKNPKTAIIERDMNRRIQIEGAPSQKALSALLMIIAAQAERLAEDSEHTLTIADLLNRTRDETLAVWKGYTDEWLKCYIEDINPTAKSIICGSLMDYAKIDYSQAGYIELRFKMGTIFREGYRTSPYWTELDVSVARSMRSKFATYLYLELAGRWKMKKTCVEWTIDELRHVLKVKPKQYDLTADLIRRAVDPAINQLTETTNFKLRYDLKRNRRKIEGIRISWTKKENDGLKITDPAKVSRADPCPVELEGNIAQRDSLSDWPKISKTQFERHKIAPSHRIELSAEFCRWIRANGYKPEAKANDRNLQDFLNEKLG